MIRIHDLETDEIIDREMTDAEFNETQARIACETAKAAEKAAATAKLAALGLTEDDLKALGLGNN